MIDRGNWRAVRDYLKYRAEVDQISSKSVRLEESRLRQLLEWADNELFSRAPAIRPAFPQYVIRARHSGEGETLSPMYVSHVIGTAHAFFRWLSRHKRGYCAITSGWLDTLKPPRMTVERGEHEAVTLGEVLAISKAKAVTVAERRIQASCCFWFLSGIRIGAFVTLPLEAVDVEKLTVRQWPKLGVKTKFGKHATTFLLRIPSLLRVVKDWDAEVRRVCGNKGLWFAQVSPETGQIVPRAEKAGDHRSSIACRDLRKWLKKSGLQYHSPHKFRHGHAVYALSMAKDVAALKAVSQNLMHGNLTVTDGVYGVLSDGDVRHQIARLGVGVDSSADADNSRLIEALQNALSRLQRG